ncbi:MAG: hypothetical protein IPL78_00805 [Chloroflexi bacterium]|nr:hypothetical protein [Chloroflexota bacterium]
MPHPSASTHPITAALCYENDLDMYTFSGVIGQNVVVDLPVRPANYYVMVYKPDGTLFKMFHPLTRPPMAKHHPQRGRQLVRGRPATHSAPTTDQYQLLLSANTTCSGLDPYEPNDEQGSGTTLGLHHRHPVRHVV